MFKKGEKYPCLKNVEGIISNDEIEGEEILEMIEIDAFDGGVMSFENIPDDFKNSFKAEYGHNTILWEKIEISNAYIKGAGIIVLDCKIE
ncbi:MAG: hypothetical protein HUJ98_04930 [Bacteroidaceae bacterium]|nr:hypothetical protein [Bacteroidaceae bacterium]